MADVTFIRAGRWALTRPVQESDGAWTTVAAQQRLAKRIEMYWPPRQADGTPLVNAVLVRGVGNLVAPPDTDTEVFPRDLVDLAEVTLGELTAQQRNAWRSVLENWLTGYTFTDYDGTVRMIPAFSEVTATYTLATTLKQVARDIFRHFAHSASRPRSSLREPHNTEFTDNFSTDPFVARWTKEDGDAAYDAGNSEIDCDMSNDVLLRYQANSPGSIEHEAQITGQGSTGALNKLPGAAVRCDNTGAADGYFLEFGTSSNVLSILRVVATVPTVIYSDTLGSPAWQADFYSLRLAAGGVAGANVTLNGWIVSHGGSKPSDPGWQGSVGSSTTGDVVDSDAARLDDDTLNLQGGIGGRGSATSEEDTRHCFFRVRAISDRDAVRRFILH